MEPSFCPIQAGVYTNKLRQTLVFDPGGSKGRLRACPFLGTWRALLCEEVHVRAPLEKAAAFLEDR